MKTTRRNFIASIPFLGAAFGLRIPKKWTIPKDWLVTDHLGETERGKQVRRDLNAGLIYWA